MPAVAKTLLAALIAVSVAACTTPPPPEADLTPPPRVAVKDAKFDLERGARPRRY